MTRNPIPRVLSTFFITQTRALAREEQVCLSSRYMLGEEEDQEREVDRQYWAPLKKELERWRHQP